MKHTPGPWITQDAYEEFDNESGTYSTTIPIDAPISSTGYDESIEICRVSHQDEEAQGANARLIAAAPSLLEACQRLIRQYEIVTPNYMGVEAVVNAKQAIAAATGKD